MTAVLGVIGEIPLMWIWVAVLVAFAACINAWHQIRTPTGKKKEKRNAVYKLCAETFRLTDSFTGDKDPFFHALNHASAVFGDNESVQKAFSRLREEPGHESVLVPDLVEEMGNAVGIKINKTNISTPFTPTHKC